MLRRSELSASGTTEGVRRGELIQPLCGAEAMLIEGIAVRTTARRK